MVLCPCSHTRWERRQVGVRCTDPRSSCSPWSPAVPNSVDKDNYVDFVVGGYADSRLALLQFNGTGYSVVPCGTGFTNVSALHAGDLNGRCGAWGEGWKGGGRGGRGLSPVSAPTPSLMRG
jgi:hypothetical protein